MVFYGKCQSKMLLILTFQQKAKKLNKNNKQTNKKCFISQICVQKALSEFKHCEIYLNIYTYTFTQHGTHYPYAGYIFFRHR